MITQTRSRFGIRVRDVFFADAPCAADAVDIDVYVQCAVRFPGSTEFRTLHIDLRRERDAIWNAVASSCRYKIRRARDRDGVSCTITAAPDAAAVDRFAAFYDEEAARGGFRHANRERLRYLAATEALTLGEARDAAGQLVCAHAHMTDGRRARLLYSASSFRPLAGSDARSAVGRANRLLHWVEIEHFRERGLEIYDFGGISTDGKTAGIDWFKRQFGGREVTEYNARVGVSAIGRLALRLYGFVMTKT